MKENLFWAIFNAIVLVMVMVFVITYAISGHWILAVLYMVLASAEGYNAYRHFTLWLNIRRMIRNSKPDIE